MGKLKIYLHLLKLDFDLWQTSQDNSSHIRNIVKVKYRNYYLIKAKFTIKIIKDGRRGKRQETFRSEMRPMPHCRARREAQNGPQSPRDVGKSDRRSTGILLHGCQQEERYRMGQVYFGRLFDES